MNDFGEILRWLGAIAAGTWLMAALGMAEEVSPPTVDYLAQVKPLLRERCFTCHGSLKQKGSLRLDTVAGMLKGGDSGPVVVANDPAGSLLLSRVLEKDLAQRMPPEHEGEALTEAHVTLLRSWIAEGAPGPSDEKPEADPREHWSFRPIVRPAVPGVKNTAWVRNPIDAFVAREHEKHGITPQPEASRLQLLRRLTIDLIGLPPSPQEIDECLADTRPDWYERTVDRLLDDPRYGERWARHWMDIWRYSDWWGLGEQLRNSQRHIWHWRDWIVDSLNEDRPYDEMVRQMLAADELYPNDMEKLRATGFLARNYFLFNRNQWMEETVEHVSKGFLGLTMNCTKCHAHKYDPFEQVEFYRMRAFFEPYHVRNDMLPDEPDLNRDGLPVAFDGWPDLPTYRFERGQEKDPDKSVAIQPGVPAILEFAPLKIEPVNLPIEAWQPERREWVGKAHLKAAEARIEVARAKLAPTREKLEQARQHEAQVLAKIAEDKLKGDAALLPAPLIEKFETLDPRRWQLSGGEWQHTPGRLEQKRDGAQRSILRLVDRMPRDFEATLRFTTLAGSMWRSVGMSYDCTQADPSQPPAPQDTELSAYVSAYAGGSKVQASLFQEGKWIYPGEAASARPIELNKEYTLKLQVRDTLVNVSLNGELVITWRSPLARRDGAFQITTFDALTVLHEVTLAPLGPDVVLREGTALVPNRNTPEGAANAVAETQLELRGAELGLAVAEVEVKSVLARMRALASRGSPSSAPEEGAQTGADVDLELARRAVEAERQAAIVAAELVVAEAELKVLRAAPDKKDALTKELSTARETLDAKRKPSEPAVTFSHYSGAAWSATRFLDSTKDDPAVTFPDHSTGRRTALARWITDSRNPLTARVAVNHLWNRHLGAPLVATVFDFGRKGAEPTHPELLDWLASELMSRESEVGSRGPEVGSRGPEVGEQAQPSPQPSSWSMKHIHRLIVLSATYRMGTEINDGHLASDPDNKWLWRKSPVRLESQVVRDAILSLAGTLDESRGGPPVQPAQQADSKRRSLYFFHSNNERNQFLTMFDEALVKECYRREQSIVPQQALALTNSRVVLDAAGPVAKRLAQGVNNDHEFVKRAFRVLLADDPGEAELRASLNSMEAWRKLTEAGTGDSSIEFARANLVWVLLNHNDFVTVR